jgi:hypothetical protein
VRAGPGERDPLGALAGRGKHAHAMHDPKPDTTATGGARPTCSSRVKSKDPPAAYPSKLSLSPPPDDASIARVTYENCITHNLGIGYCNLAK